MTDLTKGESSAMTQPFGRARGVVWVPAASLSGAVKSRVANDLPLETTTVASVGIGVAQAGSLNFPGLVTWLFSSLCFCWWDLAASVSPKTQTSKTQLSKSSSSTPWSVLQAFFALAKRDGAHSLTSAGAAVVGIPVPGEEVVGEEVVGPSKLQRPGPLMVAW